MSKTRLDTILKRPDIWQSARHQHQSAGLPTGFRPLDESLHLGGWPPAGLVEILSRRQGIGEWQLLLPTLRQLSGPGRYSLLLAPPHIPYAPALITAGIEPGKVLVVESTNIVEQLWCAEQALRSGAAGVVGWFGKHKLQTSHLRKLLLAAKHSNSLLFLYRDAALAQASSPANLRLVLDAKPPGHLQLEVIKQPGGWAGQTVTLKRPEPWLNTSLRHLPTARQTTGALPLPASVSPPPIDAITRARPPEAARDTGLPHG